MIIRNEEVKELTVEIPEGHKHLRTIIKFENGKEVTLQEATIANLVRTYITVKTHPGIKRVYLRGKSLVERKEGYAEWQLIEESDKTL